MSESQSESQSRIESHSQSKLESALLAQYFHRYSHSYCYSHSQTHSISLLHTYILRHILLLILLSTVYCLHLTEGGTGRGLTLSKMTKILAGSKDKDAVKYEGIASKIRALCVTSHTKSGGRSYQPNGVLSANRCVCVSVCV